MRIRLGGLGTSHVDRNRGDAGAGGLPRRRRSLPTCPRHRPRSSAPTPPPAAPALGRQCRQRHRAPARRAEMIAQAGSATPCTSLPTARTWTAKRQSHRSPRSSAWLQKNPGVRVTVEGHCDERGTREYNLALGERRANSAKNILVNGRRGCGPHQRHQLRQGTHPVALPDRTKAPGRRTAAPSRWCRSNA